MIDVNIKTQSFESLFTEFGAVCRGINNRKQLGALQIDTKGKQLIIYEFDDFLTEMSKTFISFG